MEQFDQLLTCAICLDKFRNPKLLPCQHSYCLECLENLVDYVRKQVKCPECRQCHPLHYNGVQAFPTNVTIQRFLELHLEITGELPDPTTNQIMERCQVCSEKAYLAPCAHCEKRVCPDCKEGHMEVLKREISRISNQVRRVLHRLDDALTSSEKNSIQLQSNMMTIMEEIDDVCRRVTKAIKDRADNLKYEIEKYGTGEIKNLITLRSNIEQELSNIKSNCELVEKYITPTDTNGTWQDNELMDTKDIFLKTMEFIRNFEYESGDFGRRIRFTMNIEPNTLVLQLSTLGDLILPNYNANNSNNNTSNSLGSLPSSQSGLMRSKSDHRLTTQFRQQQQDYDDPPCGRTSPVLGVGRKFGERRTYGDSSDQEPERKSRFRSRFTRHLDAAFEDSPVESSRGVRFEAEKKERERVLDTEDVTRGPLSGVTRLNDSPIVLQRIQESEYPKPIKPAPEKVVAPAIVQAAQLPHLAPWRLSRQTSEEDEVTKQKKQNKQAEAAETASKRAPSIARRVSNEPRSPQERNPSRGASQEVSSEPQPEPVRPTTRKLSPDKFPKVRSESSESGSSESSTSSSRSTGAVFTTDELKNRFLTKSEPEKPTTGVRSRYAAGGAAASSAKPVASRNTPVAESKSSSEESTEEEESSDDEESKTPAEPTKVQARMAKTDIGPLLARSAVAREPIGSSSSSTARAAVAERDTPRERDLPPRDYREREAPPRDPYRKREPSPPSSHSLSAYRRNREAARMTSPPSRDNYGSTTSTNRYGLSDYPTGSSNLARSRTGTSLYPGSDGPSLTSKYSALNRSRHSFDEPDPPSTRSSYATATAGDMDKGTRLSNLRDRRARIARSKSSHDVLAGLDPEEAEQLGLEDPNDYIRARRKSTTTPDSESLSSWAKYLKNKYGKGSSGVSHDEPLETTRRSPKLISSSFSNPYSCKKRLLFKFGSRGSGPGEFTWPRGVACGPDGIIAVADSSNHRVQIFDQHGNYMKEIGTYGNGDGEFDCLAGVAINRIGQFIVSDRYNHRIQIFDPSGNFLRAFGSQGTSDGKFNYPWGICTDALGFIYVCDKENNRIQVFQSDGTFVGKFGVQGRGLGDLDHPHYIAVTTTNRVVVSDSNNHRIQIFDVNGRLLSSFGTEGCDENQFKLPRGIAVDGNNIIIGDSGNNRVQIFTQDGQFLKSLGNWGCGDLEFKGMEGISISSNGNIIIADRENHRIQVL